MSIGYARQGRPNVKRGGEVARIVTPAELATIMREQDPFGLELHCTNAGGHQPIASCGEIVCCHCARVFWR